MNFLKRKVLKSEENKKYALELVDYSQVDRIYNQIISYREVCKSDKTSIFRKRRFKRNCGMEF